MAIFYKCINNGVIALMPERVFHELEAQYEWEMRTQLEHNGREPGVRIPIPPYPRPIFTFVDRDRHFNLYLQLANHLTGTTEVMDSLLIGHTVREEGFHVPFSSKIEQDSSHPLYDDEMNFRTTLWQAISEFGLVRAG